MSTQLEKNWDFIARYCAHWDTPIIVKQCKDTKMWTIKAGAGASYDRVATHESRDEAFRLLAIKLHAILTAENEKCVNKMIEEVTENKTIIGDWSKD